MFTAYQYNPESDPADDDDKVDIEEALARRLEMRQRNLEAKLAQKEERRKKLEEKLSANKAVKMGQELFKTNDIFSGEHRDRHQKILQRQEEQEARMKEHKEKCSKIVGKMQEKITAHNAASEETAKEFEEKAAKIKAEQERLKAEKAAKKVDLNQKWNKYEVRKAVRHGDPIPEQQTTPAPAPAPKVAPVVKPQPAPVVKQAAPAPVVKQPAPAPKRSSYVAPKKTAAPKRGKGGINLDFSAPCVVNHSS